jgi:tRNA A-37 threonylcarbamoyl transferase component Bud32
MRARMAFPPGLRVGRYEVVRKLGQGGFGILYVGRDVELDREVALKFLRPEHLTRPDVVQRFLQEARSAAKIHHAGIVTVFECGQVNGTGTRADDTVYIAMELLHGESLHVRLKREKRLAPDLAVNITRQVCSALMAAHVAGIVHRDLKPDNLFLVPDSAVRGGVRVKILDFGVAKLADGQFDSGVRTHSAMLLGTPMYMSPEQCKSSAKVDHRSDIYAVGCILFQLLCGRAPYEGDAGELIAQHQLAPIPTPRSFAPDVSTPLEALVTQMLAKAPDERPSMDAVESALASLDATSLIASPAALAPTIAAKNETAPTSVTTLYEGVGEQTAVEQKRQRRNLALGAAGVIVFGVLLGVIVTRGGKEPDQVARQPAQIEPTPASLDAASASIDAALEIDAAPTPVVPSEVPAPIETNASEELALRCTKLRADRKWDDLVSCGDELAALDPGRGNEFREVGITENKSEALVRKLVDAVKDEDFDEVRTIHRLVPEDSVYRREASALLEKATDTEKELLARKATKAMRASLVESDASSTACDAEALKKKGDDYLGNGMDTAALAQFEASLRCKYDTGTIKNAFVAACRSKQSAKAKIYYAKLPSPGSYAQICLRFGVQVP